MNKKRIIPFITALFLILSANAGFCLRDIEENENQPPQVVIANPALIPDSKKPLIIPENASDSEKIDILIDEIQKLRIMSMRATLLIDVELQLRDKHNREGIKVSLRGGNLEEEISCKTNNIGQCVFILDPNTEDMDDYEIVIKKLKFKTTKEKIRLQPGSIIILPVRVEMTDVELERRINPPD
ncbi:MAG TPA: hypothetical protein PLN69_03620 [bacterium]|nr:hypothetical protein [bacterium]